MLRQMEFDWSACDQSGDDDALFDACQPRWISRERGFGLFLLAMIKSSQQALGRWGRLWLAGESSKLQLNEQILVRDAAAASLAWICSDDRSSVTTFCSACDLHDVDPEAIREAILKSLPPESIPTLVRILSLDLEPDAA